MVGNIYDVMTEGVVLPGSWRVLNHCQDSLVLLIVNRVKVDCLWPHLVSLALANQSGDHHLAIVRTYKVHQVLLAVLSIHNTKICVDALMGTLKIHALLE